MTDDILSREADILDGHLLGDGSVFKTGYDCNRNAVFVISSKHEEYLQWIIDNTQTFKVCRVTVNDIWDKRTQKFYHRCLLKSHSHAQLTQRRELWYPQGKKIVPSNLVITPRLLLRWYMDDGHLHSQGIYFNTQGFTLNDTEFLRDKLVECLGIKVTIQIHSRSKNLYRLFIPIRGTKQGVASTNNNVTKFFNIIGNCPVKCFKHKWGE